MTENNDRPRRQTERPRSVGNARRSADVPARSRGEASGRTRSGNATPARTRSSATPARTRSSATPARTRGDAPARSRSAAPARTRSAASERTRGAASDRTRNTEQSRSTERTRTAPPRKNQTSRHRPNAATSADAQRRAASDSASRRDAASIRANARNRRQQQPQASDVPPEIAELRYADKLPKQCYKFLTGIFLAVIVVLALAGIIMPDREFSDEENRMLATFPHVSVAGIQSASYMGDLESYIADQFPGRDAWMRIKMRMDLMAGEREFNGVFMGRDHYLIQAPAEPDYEQVSENIQSMNAFAERHGDLNFSMLIAPNAATIMADWLPRGAVVHDQSADRDYIHENCTIPDIDVTGTFTAHAEEGLYYHTDHHWTSLGARYAFEEAAPSLGIEPVTDYNVYAVANNFQGTLASSSGYHGAYDVIEVYEPLGVDVQYLVTDSDDSSKRPSVYNSAMLQEKDKYQVFFGGNHGVVQITTSRVVNRHLLVIKDSYANSFVPFLIPYFNTITMVDPRYCSDDIDDLISSNGITDVLFLYNLDTFMQDTNLSTVLGLPATE